MKQSKLSRRILSFVLCFSLIVSCMAGAFSAFAATITEYTTAAFGDDVASVKAEITADNNLLLSSTLNKTTNLSSLSGRQYTVTATAVDENGSKVNTWLTGNNPVHLADGSLPWVSGQNEITAFISSSNHSGYASPNGRIVSAYNDMSGFRTDTWYDITFKMDAVSDIDKIIVVNSTGLNWQTLGAYEVHVATNINELYTDASLVYTVDNNNKSTIQSINCDDNVVGCYLGIRITQGVNDNFLDSTYDANYSFPRVFEIAAIGTPLYTVINSNPNKSNDTMIAGQTPSGMTIADSIILGSAPSATGSNQGKVLAQNNCVHTDRLPSMVDGYHNDTSKTNCDMTYAVFAHQDGDNWIMHNGWDTTTKTWDYDNVDSYIQFTYDLSCEYDLTDFWISHENSASRALSLGAYELYASNKANELFASNNMVARFANVNLDTFQQFHFEQPVKARYFGVKVIMGIQGTAFQQHNCARITEMALFGTTDATSIVTYGKPTLSNASMITDKTEDGKTIEENILFGKSPATSGKQNGKSTTVHTGNLFRVNDGYYYSKSGETCDISGVKFVTEPYTYDANGGITGGKYTNGWNPATRTYNENAVDTYATFTYNLGKVYDISDFWMFNEANANLQTAVYEVYVGNERATLYNAENKAFTYVNTSDSGWVQKVRFLDKPQGKYLGIKIIMGVTSTTWETPYSYMRLIEIAAFGEEATELADVRNFIETVDFSNIEIEDAFWSGRQDQTLLVSFDHAAKEFNNVGAIKNFLTSAKLYNDAISELGENATELEVLALMKEWQTNTATYPRYSGNFASDSDVYKVIEGMAYAIENYDESTDPEIQAGVAKIKGYLNEWIPAIISAQGRDGYLNTVYTIYYNADWVPDSSPTGRFQSRGMHELYCLGHLFEAAVAMYNATGDRRLLDASMKSFDMLYSVFFKKNHETYKATFSSPGHEEIELALVKLAATVYDIADYGPEYAEKCIELTQFFLDNQYKQNASPLKSAPYVAISDLTEAWGHCVRAFYLYTGMADLSIAKGELLYSNLETLWENVETKTYVTGGIGHRTYTEGLPESYELPNDEDLAYCETCASISNVFWNKSMFKIFGDSKYFDNIEKQLYNNVLSGVGLDGTSFNYTNNLETIEGYLRTSWKGTPCCPTNLVRLINKLSEYIYATDKETNTAYVNLFIGSKGNFDLGDTNIGVDMTSSMPWEGNAALTLSLESTKEFTLKFRLPSWAKGANAITINGESYTATAGSDGYVAITRNWANGDVITLNFPMSVEFVRNGDVIPANKGLTAVTRGPITYCVEQQDSTTELDLLCINEESTITPEFVTNFVADNTYGTAELQVLRVTGQTISDYQKGNNNTVNFTLIPYLAWSNRGADGMKVYLRDGSEDYDTWDYNKTVAGNATPSASTSHSNSPISKVNDSDKAYGSRWSSWLSSAYPENSKNPTVTYDFGINYVKLTATDVYFFTDGGGCQLPEVVDIEYWNGSEWVDVTITNTPEFTFQTRYSSGNNEIYLANYQFEEIVTNQIRMNLSHSTRAHAISEWELIGERVKEVATVEPSAETINGEDATSEAITFKGGYAAAGQITISAAKTISIGSVNYEFDHWELGSEITYNSDLTFTASANETYAPKAIYAEVLPEDAFTVTFLQKNGSLIKAITTATALNEEDLAARGVVADNIFGYEFVGWNADISNITSDTTVLPVYAKSTDESVKCIVTLQNGLIEGQTSFAADFNDRVTAVADKVTGKTFSHWVNGTGDVVSTNASYTFFVPSSITLTAVYYDDGAVAPEVAVTKVVLNEKPLYSVVDGNYNVAYTATVSLPADAIVIEQGVVIGGIDYNNSPASLNLNSYNIKGSAKNLERVNFMITLIGVKAGKTRNARAFVTYTLNGETVTAYSESVVRIVATNDGFDYSVHSAN